VLKRFLNTRTPSVLCAVAFIACCLMFCHTLWQMRDTAEVTSQILRALLVWGTLSLGTMLLFCLCLAKVTRYRRRLPPDRFACIELSK
jgi:cytochrome bd-type quinol oxidase subunit 2